MVDDIVGDKVSDTILVPNSALKLTLQLLLPPACNSLQPKTYHLDLHIPPIINLSCTNIRFSALGIHPSISGYKFFITPKSSPPLPQTPLYMMSMPPLTLDLPSLCTGCTYFQQNPQFRQKLIPAQSCPSSSLFCIKNVPNIHTRTGANGPQLPICRHTSQSLNITPSLLNTKSLNPGVQICFAMWSQGLSYWGKASLSLGVHLPPGLATILEKLQFSQLGVLYLIFTFHPVCSCDTRYSLTCTIPLSLRMVFLLTCVPSLAHNLVFCNCA